MIAVKLGLRYGSQSLESEEIIVYEPSFTDDAVKSIFPTGQNENKIIA